MCRYAKVFCCAVLASSLIVTLAHGDDFPNDVSIRDKRTVDHLVRGFADLFGYDVQKRPTVIPPPPPPTPKPKPPPPPPPKPTQPAPKKPTTPNLVKEIVRKSFNINFNWNHNRGQPIIPVGPKKPGPPAAPPAPPAPKAPVAPPKAPPKKPLPPPPPPPKKPATPEHKPPPPKPTAHPPPPKPQPTKKKAPKAPPKEAPKKPAKIAAPQEEEVYDYQPEETPEKQPQANYENDYEQPLYRNSEYHEASIETTTQQQYENVQKLKHDFERNFENNQNLAPEQYDYVDFAGFTEKPSAPQALAPEPRQPQNFDKHYEDFVHFSNNIQSTTERDVSKSELSSSLNDFWQKSPLKNEHGYKFLVEEGAGATTQSTPQEEGGQYFKTYYYYPEAEQEEERDRNFGERIATTTPNPHVDEVERVPRRRPMKAKSGDEHGTFVPTKFDGDASFIPTKLQRLQNEDTKIFSVGAGSPFDHEYDSSEVRERKAPPRRASDGEDPHESYVYFYRPDSYEGEYTFTATPEHLQEQEQRQRVEATAGVAPKADDDGDLSRNAKVETKEYAKRIVTLHKNAGTRMNA